MPSSALRKIQRLLGQLHGGIDATRAFIGELLRLKLIEPIDISMTFDDGTQLDQSWVRSADGHHLTVTETWKPNDLQQPVTFKRSYDRLDL